MSELKTTEDIKSYLYQALDVLSPIKQCALLDYPSYYNIGDHLIWLGTIFYLNNVLKINIKYTTSITNFSPEALEKKNQNLPILLQGGGNMGDLWSKFQEFREFIISKYPGSKIIILPQSLYYRDISKLERTAKIFNSHPDLTIFIRDNYGYDIATKYFDNCLVIKAPDMALAMVDLPQLPLKKPSSNSILYLYRNDKENDKQFAPKNLGLSDLVVEDWVAFSWMCKLPKKWIYIPGLVKLVREGWQRGLATPQEFLSRQRWEKLHPYATTFKQVDCPALHRKSWSLMHSGITQLQQYSLVITNRLHVHILCLLLNKPHVLLPGSYYKIEAFYNTWTKEIPLAKFVKAPSEVSSAVTELLELYNINYKGLIK